MEGREREKPVVTHESQRIPVSIFVVVWHNEVTNNTWIFTGPLLNTSPVVPHDSCIEAIHSLVATPVAMVDDTKHPPSPPPPADQRTSTVVLAGVRASCVEACTQVFPGNCMAIGIFVATIAAEREKEIACV